MTADSKVGHVHTKTSELAPNLNGLFKMCSKGLWRFIFLCELQSVALAWLEFWTYLIFIFILYNVLVGVIKLLHMSAARPSLVSVSLKVRQVWAVSLSSDSWETFWRQSKNILETIWRHLETIPETSGRHPGDIYETFKRHFRDIQETPSMNLIRQLLFGRLEVSEIIL